MEAISNSIKLFIGILFILYGLKYFKITIILAGILTGFIIGLFIGLLFQVNLILAGVIFALIFGFLAWPFQKLLVFIFCGFICSSLGLIIGINAGYSFNVIIVLSILFFIIGGWLALKFYEIIIIISFSLAGSQIIFNTYYSLDYSHIIKGWSPSLLNFYDSLRELVESLLSAFIKNTISFILVSIVFILFSLYFQKIRLKSNKIYHGNNATDSVFSGLTVGFIIIAFLEYLTPFFTNTNIMWGINIINWPLLSLITFLSLNYSKKINKIFIDKYNSHLIIYFYFILASVFNVIIISEICNSVLLLKEFSFSGLKFLVSDNTVGLLLTLFYTLFAMPYFLYILNNQLHPINKNI